MDKKELRNHYKQKRSELGADTINELSKKIAANLAPLITPDIKNIHVFLPISRFFEINTYLIKELVDQLHPGINWIISRTDFDRSELINLNWTPELTITENSYGIPEPEFGEIVSSEVIDMVLVPLLAFDNHGHRLGYGKGFYDRFLIQCRRNCETVGLSHFGPHEPLLPSDSWDIPLQFCVTPDKSYSF